MKKYLSIISCILACLYASAQEDYVLETRFRNPVDTTKFHNSPTILLFVHTHWGHGHLCATARMQKALEEDSLQIRKKRGLKLYVVYPTYKEEDIDMFDSFNPVHSEVVFYTDSKHRGAFSDKNQTPYIVLYDGKGNTFTKLGGTYEELCEMIQTKVSTLSCHKCNGTGRIEPNPRSAHPDAWGGICPVCGGKGNHK